MFSKKFLTSVCMGLSLCFCVSTKANAGIDLHVMIDKVANQLLAKIFAQETADVIIKQMNLATVIKTWTSLGDVGAIASKLNLDNFLGPTLTGAGDISGFAGGLSGALSSAGSYVGDAQGMLGEGWDAVGQAGGALSAAGSGLSEASGALSAATSAANVAGNVVKGEKIDVADAATGAGSMVSAAGAALGNEWAAVGQAGAALSTAGQVYGAVGDKVKDGKKAVKNAVAKTKSVGNVSIPAELQEIGFEGSMKDSKKMAELIRNELLPPMDGDTLTDTEKRERQKKRIAMGNANAVDGMAFSLAMEHEGSKAQEENVTTAQNVMNSASTIQDKEAARNQIAVLRLIQEIKGNAIRYMSLRVIAADKIKQMPLDYSKSRDYES